MRSIRVGIGGWVYPPWRGSFYPPQLPHRQELAFASRAVTSIEINGTFYGTRSEADFRRWHDETPDDFVFALKAPRSATHRRDLAQAIDSIERFLASGLAALGTKLGPILWQFPPSRVFDAAALQPFLAALPPRCGSLTLRHAVETYHPSFATPEWIDMLRQHQIAAAIVDSEKHTLIADQTAPFVYARLERNDAAAPDGYSAKALDAWATRLRAWAAGTPVTDIPLAGRAARPSARDCFVYFISGDKERAPDAARAMLAKLGSAP